MAKTKKNKDEILSSSMDDIYIELADESNSFVPDSTYILGEEDINADSAQFISTGSFILDTIISNRTDKGGFPVGRVSEVVGFESSGKSLLGIHACADTQRQGGIPIYLDIEKAMSIPFMAKMGVDVSKILYTKKLKTVEQVIEYNEMVIKKIIDKQLSTKQKERKPITIIWDSLAATTTQEVLEAEVGARMYPRLAMILSTRFPQIIDVLDEANVCMVVLNQLREKPNVLYGDKYYSPGGNAMKFYASLRLFMTKRSKIIVRKGQPNEAVVGYETTIETKKNKISAPARKANLDLYFNRGLSDTSGSLSILMKSGIVEGSTKATQQLVLQNGDMIPFKSAKGWEELFAVHRPWIEEKTKEALLIDLSNPDLETSIEKEYDASAAETDVDVDEEMD